MRFGEDKLIDFYINYGTGDWKPAFQQSFGVSADAFYADFEKYRAST